MKDAYKNLINTSKGFTDEEVYDYIYDLERENEELKKKLAEVQGQLELLRKDFSM